MKMTQKLTIVALLVATIGTPVFQGTRVGAKEKDKDVKEAKVKILHKLRHDGKEIEVTIPSDVFISDSQLEDIVSESDENAVRINIEGTTPASEYTKTTSENQEDLAKEDTQNVGINSSGPQYAWYDLWHVTRFQQLSRTQNAAYGQKFTYITVAEGEIDSVSSQFTHTDTFAISGKYTTAAKNEFTGSYTNETSYTISTSQEFKGPDVDPYRIVTRYFNAKAAYDELLLHWTERGNLSGDLFDSGFAYYYEPMYYVKWSEDVVLR